MAEEKVSKIEIFVGIDYHTLDNAVFWEGDPVSGDYCFAIVVNGDPKSAIISRDSGMTVEEACERRGREFNRRLREMEAKEYGLNNGERIRQSTHQRVECYDVPQNALGMFEQYLRAGGIKNKRSQPVKQEATA